MIPLPFKTSPTQTLVNLIISPPRKQYKYVTKKMINQDYGNDTCLSVTLLTSPTTLVWWLFSDSLILLLYN